MILFLLFFMKFHAILVAKYSISTPLMMENPQCLCIPLLCVFSFSLFSIHIVSMKNVTLFGSGGGSMKIKLQEYIEAFKAKYVWAIFQLFLYSVFFCINIYFISCVLCYNKSINDHILCRLQLLIVILMLLQVTVFDIPQLFPHF